ncbi:hypothetical protein BH09VER1_BH09VER1_10160 [soil metagenome]
MIDISYLPHANGPGSSSTEEDGVTRLWEELSAGYSPARSPTPEGLLGRVFEQIEAQPPRVETNAQGRVVAINPAFTLLCGYTFQEIKDRKPGSMLQGADTDPQAISTLRQAVAKAESCQVEIINYHKDGSPYRVWIEMEPIREPDGTLSGFRATETKLP